MNRYHYPVQTMRRHRRLVPVWALLLGTLLLGILSIGSTGSAKAQERTPAGRSFSLPVIIDRHTVDDPDAFVYTVRLGEYWILIARKFGVTYDELRAANPDLWTLRGELIWPGDEMAIPGLTAADQRSAEIYVVQPGDSWYRIADTTGVSYWDLRLDNLGLWQRRGTVIQPGDEMQIVSPVPIVESPEALSTDAPADAAESAEPEESAAAAPASEPVEAPAEAPAATTPVTETVSAPVDTGALPPVTGGPPFQVSNPPEDAVIYSVRPGDSWFRISGRYGMTFEKLRSANTELWALRGQNIRPADQMIIPAHGSPPPPLEIKESPPEDKGTPVSDSGYTVQEGDTWASVAASNDVTEEALKAANLEMSSRELEEGDVVRIP